MRTSTARFLFPVLLGLLGAISADSASAVVPPKPNDFNADGQPDIVWSNTANGATYLWHMNGPVLGNDVFITQIDPSWKIQGVADFNGDGHPDLVWRNTATGNSYVWYMNGVTFLSDAFLFSLPPEWVIQGVADFNADGRPDFLMRNQVSGVAFAWFFNDNTAIGDQFLFGIDPVWKVEAVADLNADGQPDLLFRHMGSGLAFAWNTQWGGGSLSLGSSSSPIFGIDPVWEIVQMEDWNGDDNPDLLFRNRDTGLVFVWYMTATRLGGSDFITQIDPSWEIVPRRPGPPAPPGTFALTVSKAGTGAGRVTSSPQGIDCGADCAESYDPRTVVTLTAAPSASTFGGWSGACTGNGDCIVTMDAARSVTATFTLDCGTGTCFLERYAADGSSPPSPASAALALSSQLQKADVGFVVDTTGSMGGEITNLKNSLSITIIPAIKARIPNLAVGIAGQDDVPFSTFGIVGQDLPYYTSLPPNGYVTTVTAASQTAANALTTHNGNDFPESQVLALHHAVTGTALTWPGGSLAAAAPPAGTYGALRFRSDALPILVNITDASFHNGKRALDKTGTSYDAALQNPYSFATLTVDDLVTRLNNIGAKFLGVASDDGARALGANDPYGYLAYLADMTNSNVPPSAFPGGTCNTGIFGTSVPADGPMADGVRLCRTVFSINGTGTGLGTAVAEGVAAVLKSVKLDIHVQAYNDAAETIDVVGNFIQRVEPHAPGGTDPFTGAVCVTIPVELLGDDFSGPKATLAGPDGVNDTIRRSATEPSYCFNVVPRPNSTVPATSAAQSFRAWLKIVAVNPAGGTFTLGPDREVLFIVPAAGS